MSAEVCGPDGGFELSLAVHAPCVEPPPLVDAEPCAGAAWLPRRQRPKRSVRSCCVRSAQLQPPPLDAGVEPRRQLAIAGEEIYQVIVALLDSIALRIDNWCTR